MAEGAASKTDKVLKITDLRIESIHGRGYRMSRTPMRIDPQVIQRSASVFQMETAPFGRLRVGLAGDPIQSPLSR